MSGVTAKAEGLVDDLTTANTIRREQVSTDHRTRIASGAEALSAYAQFAGGLSLTPAQRPDWVRNWADATGAEILVAILEGKGTRAALALEVVRSGPFRVAQFCGGRHANGNFPAVETRMGEPFAPDELFRAIRAARPDIDLVRLERQLYTHEGVANPLCALPMLQSPNPALAVDLDGGFDAVLSRTSGKRKRKKNRSQIRKFEAAGGYRLIRADSDAEVDRHLTAFFEMKALRFPKKGIENVFADQAVQTFFRNLFKQALLDDRRPFVLNGLEVAGVLRAVTGSSIAGDRLICEFGAIADDDLAGTSPGEFLFFANISGACRDGYGLYDFSVGDEPYKRLWCNRETSHFDTLVPLTGRGHALAALLRAQGSAKRRIKESPLAWSLVQRFRRLRAGAKPALPAETDD